MRQASARPASVSLFNASTVSGTDTTLESVPCAPASVARIATDHGIYGEGIGA